MSTHKYMNKICVAAIVIALLLSVFAINYAVSLDVSDGKSMGYESKLFTSDKVHTIDIVIDDWEGFLSTAQSEEYSVCSVVIDGEAVKNVGIRGKGNTSLSTVASMDSERYSFKIEFDQYDSSQNYYGLDKLCLNNIIQDNTYMKDYLTYQMMNEFDVDAPLCSYAYITVNGEDWGLYLAVEAVEESFLQRNYGNDYGELYKPDSMSFGGGRGNGKDFEMPNFAGQQEMENGNPKQQSQNTMPDFGQMNMDKMGESEIQIPDMNGKGGFGGMSSLDVKLQYIDENADSYANIFDNAKTNVTEADQNRLISSLKQLSEYKNLEEVVNIEEVLRYFVVHNFVVNGDSYTGKMIHNYYLYEEDGRLSMIPWDYNLAFGTFQGGSASSSVNEKIDEVLDDRPMQAWIFSNEEYSRKYYELYEQMLHQVDVQGIINTAYELIEPYVEKDPTAFCTFEEFQSGVETLKEFCSLRTESVKLQLNGNSEQVETGDLNLSDMGTMNNGMGGFDGHGSSDKMSFGKQENSGITERIPFDAENSDEFMGQENISKFSTEDVRKPNFQNKGMPMDIVQNSEENDTIPFVIISFLILLTGLIIAFRYKH